MAEADVGGLFEDEGDAAAPGLDEVDAAEEIGDEGIAAAGDFGGFKGPQGDAFHEGSRVADLDTVREDGDADFVRIAVVAVAEGIDDGFAEGLAVDLGDVHADESVELHADADVLENVFLRFFDQGEDVTGEVVLVDDGGGGGGGEDGAAQREGGRFGEKDAGGIEVVTVHVEAEAFEGTL